MNLVWPVGGSGARGANGCPYDDLSLLPPSFPVNERAQEREHMNMNVNMNMNMNVCAGGVRTEHLAKLCSARD
eukprot:8429718-Alexandrium_andersonii.AAC.1